MARVEGGRVEDTSSRGDLESKHIGPVARGDKLYSFPSEGMQCYHEVLSTEMTEKGCRLCRLLCHFVFNHDHSTRAFSHVNFQGREWQLDACILTPSNVTVGEYIVSFSFFLLIILK